MASALSSHGCTQPRKLTTTWPEITSRPPNRPLRQFGRPLPRQPWPSPSCKQTNANARLQFQQLHNICCPAPPHLPNCCDRGRCTLHNMFIAIARIAWFVRRDAQCFALFLEPLGELINQCGVHLVVVPLQIRFHLTDPTRNAPPTRCRADARPATPVVRSQNNNIVTSTALSAWVYGVVH